ncbi:MAG: class I SAM-dependent methyltransferase [Acidimicrobiia bacterium]
MLLAQHRSGGVHHDIGARRLARALLTRWPGARAEADLTRAHLGAGAGRRLLDVGCGDGTLLDGLRQLGWSCAGLDPDATAAAVARRRGLDVRVGTVPAEAFPGERFDAIVACHVIEHVPDPHQFLAALLDAMASEGELVLLTPNIRSRLFGRVGKNWLNLDPPRHLQLFDDESLAGLVSASGFEVQSLRSSIRSVNLNSRAAREIARHQAFDMTRPASLMARLRAELSVLGAAWHERRHPMRGEELVLIARARVG